MRIALFGLVFVVVVVGVLADEFTDLSPMNDELGRVEAIEDMIYQDSDVLKAITFSVTYKDRKWVEVLEDLLERIDDFIDSIRNKETIKNAQYYRYCIQNVIKYTIKWLGEEVQNLMLDVNERKDDVELVIKKNIAEFLYYSASDHGMDLTLEHKDLTLNSWKKKSKGRSKKKKEKAKKDEAANAPVDSKTEAVKTQKQKVHTDEL